MENFKLETDERKSMMEFTAKALGGVDEQWSDREVLLNYNKALATFILLVSKNRK